MEEEVLRTEHISKSFGRVAALKDASIHLAKGEVLGLLGDNGAGKSTFLKILTGFHQPSGGKIYFLGKEIELKSVSHARSLGIEPVYQDLALISELTFTVICSFSAKSCPTAFLEFWMIARCGRAP